MNVVIMAQGQQSRLSSLGIPKQLLPLPLCGATVMTRTIRQVRTLSAGRIAVICTPATDAAAARHDLLWAQRRVVLQPGNSTIRGLQQVAEAAPDVLEGDVVVLLGDVCYSNSALQHLLERPGREVLFVGSPDLSRGGGELYGVSWAASASGVMHKMIAEAAVPPGDKYQPGQLRRLLWAYQAHWCLNTPAVRRRGATRGEEAQQQPMKDATWWQPVNDYTRDFDTQDDLRRLGDADVEAFLDDEAWARRSLRLVHGLKIADGG